jgi:hypothetical protein
MGLFKDLKKMTEQAAEAQKNAAQLQQAHAQGQTGTAGWDQQLANANAINNAVPYEDNAPEIAAVNGLSLKLYADIAYDTQHMGADDAARAQYAESQGLAPGTWQSSAQHWSSQMMSDPRINKTFNKFWREAASRGR